MKLYYLIYLLHIPFIFIRKQKIFFFMFVSLYFTMSFIRWETGTDWETYKYFFENIETHSYLMERGYGYLNLFVYKISSSYTSLLFTIGLIIFSFKYTTVYKYSKNSILSLIAAFSLQRGDIFFVRQNLALAIVFFSVRYIIEKNKIKFIVCILLASLIHVSSIIFLPAYCIFNLKIKIKNLIIIFWASIFSGLLLEKILKLLSSTLFSGSYLGYKMVRYIGSDLSGYGNGRSWFSIMLRSSINKIFLLVIFVYVFEKARKNNSLLNGFLNLYYISFIIFMIFGTINIALLRLGLYYEQFQVILFSYLTLLFKGRNQKCFVVVIVILYLFLRLKLNYLNYYDEFVPYKTIFER